MLKSSVPGQYIAWYWLLLKSWIHLIDDGFIFNLLNISRPIEWLMQCLRAAVDMLLLASCVCDLLSFLAAPAASGDDR
jgi:hypothetical protein